MRTLGASAGARGARYGSQSGVESRMSRAILPLKGFIVASGGGKGPQKGRSCRRARGPPRGAMRRLTPWETTAAVPTTAAVRATGRPITPRRATRAGRRGMSDSLTLRRELGLQRGHDRLDRDPPAGDELPAGPPSGRGERGGTGVLPDDPARGAAVVHGLGQVSDALRGENLGHLGLQHPQLVERLQVVQLE